jgi:hypothetical protein
MDIAPAMVEQARVNAAQEGLNAEFEEGDAEALQYTDNSFDVVATMFGAMFAPRPDLTAQSCYECANREVESRWANWTPTGFVGQMFKTTAAHVPRLQGMPSPVLWGVEQTVRERFGDAVSSLEVKPRNMLFKFAMPPADVVEHYRNYYGPTQKAFGALDADGQAALRKDLEKLWSDKQSRH